MVKLRAPSFAGKPIEEWLGAGVGESPCCSVCGDRPCRTVEVGGSTYEAIPEDLIVRAAMLAASDMIDPGSDPAASSSSWTRSGSGSGW